MTTTIQITGTGMPGRCNVARDGAEERADSGLLKVRALQRDGPAVREDKRCANGHFQHRQGRDERRKIQLDDRKRVNPTGRASDRDRDEQRCGDERKAAQTKELAKSAATTPVRATSDPTERSMPAVMMTNV